MKNYRTLREKIYKNLEEITSLREKSWISEELRKALTKEWDRQFKKVVSLYTAEREEMQEIVRQALEDEADRGNLDRRYLKEELAEIMEDYTLAQLKKMYL